MGFFDPLGFAEKADEKTLKRYREAEVTHGRVAMLAVVGFFVGEAVEGSSFLFDGQISGPAISHFTQVLMDGMHLSLPSLGRLRHNEHRLVGLIRRTHPTINQVYYVMTTTPVISASILSASNPRIKMSLIP